ncbi:hypothetical protein K1W54_19540, partial [Micromonospora sp. CPCC 205371]|nr:hypothetical protein [Micromonospora sp. CPCC 205371]
MVVVGAVFGVVSELVGFGWGAPGRWVPDLAVGLAFIGAGAWAWSVARGSAVLLSGTGLAWFAANLLPGALYLHRGVLVHLLLAYPGWRPRSRAAAAGVVLGYVVAVYPDWWSETVTLALAGVLLALLAWGYVRAVGRTRRHRWVALGCGLVFAGVLGVGAVARLSAPGGPAVTPALLLYEGALCAVAVGIVANLRGDPASAVTDLVVELGESRSGPLRDALARTLGDPSLSIGYRQAGSGRYVDAAGAPLVIPDGDAARSVRYLERDRRPFAVLVHDPAVLSDSALVAAVAAATELAAANAALHAEVRARLVEVAASRRRLLRAADEQRHRLEERLHDGPRRGPPAGLGGAGRPGGGGGG